MINAATMVPTCAATLPVLSLRNVPHYIISACKTQGVQVWQNTTDFLTFLFTYVYKYVDQKGMVAMLVIKRSVGVAPEVTLRNSMHGGNKACKQGIHSGFETQVRCHQKSKIGTSVAPQKTDVLQFFKEKVSLLSFV